jgi:hypothetical protein
MPSLEEIVKAITSPAEVFTLEELEELTVEEIMAEVVLGNVHGNAHNKDWDSYWDYSVNLEFPRVWPSAHRSKITFEITTGGLNSSLYSVEGAVALFMNYARDGENLVMNNQWQAGAADDGSVDPTRLLECAAHEIETEWGAIDHDNDPADKAFKMARGYMDFYYNALRLFGETVYFKLRDLLERD